MDQAAKLRQLMSKQSKKSIEPMNPLRIITVASGKGGVGKSNLVANVAIAMQQKGKRVVVLDADFGFANIDVILNITARSSFIDIITYRKSIMDVLTEGPGGIKFISGAYDVYKLKDINEESMDHLINNFNLLSQIADVLIIDTGAGLQQSALPFIKISDDIIIITTPEPTAITDAYSLVKNISAKGIVRENAQIHVVSNMVDSEEEAQEVYKRLCIVVTKFLGFKMNYLGSIPYDRNLRTSVVRQQPLIVRVPRSKSAVAIDHIAVRLMNGNVVKQKGDSFRNLFKSIFNL